MKTFTLHSFRQRKFGLQLCLMLLLVSWLGLRQFSIFHNQQHILNPDSHCALCVSSANFDNVLPVSTLCLAIPPQATFQTPVRQTYYCAVALLVVGNRDPPLLTLS